MRDDANGCKLASKAPAVCHQTASPRSPTECICVMTILSRIPFVWWSVSTPWLKNKRWPTGPPFFLFLFLSPCSFALFHYSSLPHSLRTGGGGQKTDPNCISHRDAAEAQLAVCLWCSAGSGWTHPLSASCLMRSNTRTGHMDPRCVLARGSPDSEPAETLSEGGTGNLCPFSTFRNLGMLTSGVSWIVFAPVQAFTFTVTPNIRRWRKFHTMFFGDIQVSNTLFAVSFSPNPWEHNSLNY